MPINGLRAAGRQQVQFDPNPVVFPKWMIDGFAEWLGFDPRGKNKVDMTVKLNTYLQLCLDRKNPHAQEALGRSRSQQFSMTDQMFLVAFDAKWGYHKPLTQKEIDEPNFPVSDGDRFWSHDDKPANMTGSDRNRLEVEEA